MKVYFISGLGADKTVFQLLDLTYCEPVFIDWITPFKNEPLPQYALRLKEETGIPDDAVIVGLSFGGMLSTEIAKVFPQANVILLSSSKTGAEIPPLYKTGKYLPLYKWSPAPLQKFFMRNYEGMFGITSKRGKEIYQKLIAQSDIGFNKWAVWALLHWDNTEIPANVVHIHGTSDKILHYKNVRCDITIPNGGHLMVMEQAVEMSVILKKLILKK
jgi:pimeloyl-ACP methyl ester carboxylesterase